MKKKLGLVVVLVIIFLVSVTFFIRKNEESDDIVLPVEKVIISDDPIDPNTHHTFTPYTSQEEE